MIINHYSLIIFSLFLYSGTVFSQGQFEQIRFSQIKEGLPSRGINTILEDKDGYIWFGTNGLGLYRFDGGNFKNFSYKDGDSTSIKGNFIYAQKIDDKDRMWVGTDNGLNLFNSELETFEQIELFKEKKQGPIGVSAILQYDDDHLLLGTYDKMVFKLNLTTYDITPIPFDKSLTEKVHVQEIIKYAEKVYLITYSGLLLLNELEDKIEVATFTTEDGIKTISKALESACIDDENNLWIGTRENGLIKISSNLDEIQRLPFTTNRLLACLVTKEKQLICSSENEGLILVEKNPSDVNQYSYKKFNVNAIPSNSVWSLYQDSQDRIWVGTFNKGACVYDKAHTKFNNIQHPSQQDHLKSRAISSIIGDNSGNIWIGMDGSGIKIYNPSTLQLQEINTKVKSNYEGLTRDDIIGLYNDSKGNIWFGTWGGGIYFLKNGTKKFINYTIENTQGQLPSNRIFNFAEDSSGRVWLTSFDSGLIYYEQETNTFHHCSSHPFELHGLAKTQIRTIKVDDEDNLWIGAPHGLFKGTFEEDTLGNLSFEIISFKQEMRDASKNHTSANKIGSIIFTKEHGVWIGTEGAGLFNIDENNVFNKFKHKDFSEEVIGTIINGEDNSIWVSGANGISHIKLDSDEVIMFNKEDGFLSNIYFLASVYRAEDGTVYYGSENRLNYFNPKEIKTNQNLPKLQFTDFKIFNKEITTDQEDSPLSKVISKTNKITLNHDQDFFTIGYIGINFTRPEKNQYAFKLEGIDPDWQYVGNQEKATYTNIKSGNYVFKVKASNSDGLWTEASLDLAITILPPWWKSTIAYLCYLVLFIGAVLFLVKYMQQRFQTKHLKEIEDEKRMQEEKLNQQKLEFFTNISHEFKTPLTLIINPLQDIIRSNDFNLPEEIKNKHRTIYKNSQRLNRLINELMDFRKLQFHKMIVQVEQLEVVTYVNDMLSYFYEEANHRNIQLQFKSESDSLVAWLDVSMLEKIIFNLVSNAFKVVPNNGTIIVSIRQILTIFPLSDFTEPKEGFEISVQDSGGGLTQSEIGQIFKRYNQEIKSKNAYYEGTGIGLEVSKSFTELLKGKIDVSSEVGKGANFMISFMLGKEHFSNNEIIEQKFISITTRNKPSISTKSNPISVEKVQKIGTVKLEKPTKKEHTILIIEDNMDLGNYLKFELEKKYDILLAENGAVGYEIALKHTPDIILTDVMMPILDGNELCEKIKSDMKTSHIPVVMLTAKSKLTDKVEGIEFGADAFLTKPIEMALLRSTLKQLLSSRQILINKYSKGSFEINKDAPKKLSQIDNVFIQNMVTYINENLSNPDLTVETIASHFFLSRSQLYRKTKSLTGISVNEFTKKLRLEKGKEMIQKGEGNITEISFNVGFSSPSYFAKCFKEEYGKLPTEVEIES